jgi:multiple antibiotic resistance protein
VNYLWRHFALGFSALLPVVNPLGSALVFLGLVGIQPPTLYKSLARKIAVDMVLFFAVIEFVGSYVLAFFGISLSIVQLSGGLVVAAIGWSLLNQPDPNKKTTTSDTQIGQRGENWAAKAFYPLMFPVTVGPGCLVVMLTLSAHTGGGSLTGRLLARAGLMLAVIVLAILVYLCYAYAPQITSKIAPSTAHGILRVIAFILLCIGVQIAWNGLEPMLRGIMQSVPVRL